MCVMSCSVGLRTCSFSIPDGSSNHSRIWADQEIEDLLPEKPRHDTYCDEGDAYLDDPGPKLVQVLDQGHPRLVTRTGGESEAASHPALRYLSRA